MADGSEYKGHYGVSADTLRDFHRRRAELLWQAGADVLLFETEPSLMEAEVEAQIAEELGAPYWISFSCCDGRHNCEGQLLADCARQLARNYPHRQAIGVNCTKPEYIASLIGELKRASDLPIIVYPNSGEEYDPQTKTWHGVGTDRRFGDYALDYMKAGAVAVGGCCTTVADHIRQVVAARRTYTGK
ncbi:homocysteine S-methyltransferase family protein [Megasphaera sp.]|uniref:homocysteine S-methyltransferase family protein n=1 Tax=Megasphaera sp. TaxID=2023260 RepID=UPI004026EDA1